MTPNSKKLGTVLVVGATGSVGRHAVAEAVRQGWETRALVRNPSRAGKLDAGAHLVVGELTRAETLKDAVEGINAVIFTQGSSYGDAAAAEAVDYGAVKNVLRASGNDYTIVRPGWFDYNDAGQLEITLLQGDTRHAGSPADGVIARHQITRVLVESLSSEAAKRLSFELAAEHGPAQADLEPVFAALDKDPAGSVDGVRDQRNQPSDVEPEQVLQDLAAVAARA